MKAFAILPIVLSYVNTAAGWSKSNHWTTSLNTWGDTITYSDSVYPTGTASATLTNTSTSLWSISADFEYTFVITVYDLFYAPTADVCNVLSESCQTPTPSETDSDLATRYWIPVPVANPTSCTKTSFEYTTAAMVYLPSSIPYGLIDDITDVAQQATQSVEALFITTHVSTVSTNMGGQAVTTTVCDVYLRSDAVTGVTAPETSILTECMDPREYYCQQFSSLTWEGVTHFGKSTCELSGQTYPPTAIAGVAATGTASPTKSSGAGGLGVSSMEFGVSLAVSGFAVLLVSFY